MGIDLADITEAMRARMCPTDRKALGKRGLTNAEARDKYCTRTERAIHGQFSGFCKRNGFIVWHSNPARKGSIRTGLPDFLLWKNGRAFGVEFKVPPNDLSEVQKEVIAECGQVVNTVAVCTEITPGEAYAMAIKAVQEFFNLAGLE